MNVDKDFQPFHEKKDNEEFSAWDFQIAKPEEVPDIDPKIALEEEYRKVRAQAHEAGYQEGLQKAEAEISQLKSDLASWIDFIQNPIRLLDKIVSDEIVQTIYWICEACIGLELSLNPQKILLLVEEIKKELPTVKGGKQLAMHPQDAEWIRNQLHKQKVSSVTEILVDDPELVRGDFYLRGEHNELDGRLKTRFMQLFATQFSVEEASVHNKLTNLDEFYDSL